MAVGNGAGRDDQRLLDTAHSWGTSPRPARHLSPRIEPLTAAEILWEVVSPGALMLCDGPQVFPILVPWGQAPVTARNRQARHIAGGLYESSEAKPGVGYPVDEPRGRESSDASAGAGPGLFPIDNAFDDPWRTSRGANVTPHGIGYQRLGDERVRPGRHDPLHPYGEPDYVLDILEANGYGLPSASLDGQAAGQMRDKHRQAVALSEYLKYDTVLNDDGVPMRGPRVADLRTDWRKVFPGETGGGGPVTLAHVLNHKSAATLINALDTAHRHDLGRPLYQPGPVNFPPLSVAFDLAQPDARPIDPKDFRRRLALGRMLGWLLGLFPWVLGSALPGELGKLPRVTATKDWFEDAPMALGLSRWHRNAVREYYQGARVHAHRAIELLPATGPQKSLIVARRAFEPDADGVDAAARRESATWTEADLLQSALDEDDVVRYLALQDAFKQMRKQRAAAQDALRQDTKRARRR